MYSVLKMKIKTIILSLFILIFLSALIIFPSEASEGVKKGLNYSGSLLIPSLFPFMVLSSFITRSGFSEIVGRIFAKPVRIIFGLPPICSSAIILSLVGGFPVGAKCVRLLYDNKQISSTQAQQMMLFCVCSGPAFLITAIGSIMLNNIKSGIILYISQIVSCIILGVISRIIYPENSVFKSSDKKTKNKANIVSSFILSSSDGAKAITEMTALVVLFSMFINIFEDTGLNSSVEFLLLHIGISKQLSDVIIPIFLEITSACSKICNGGLSLWVLSFAVGFGGICVHLQILSILNGIKVQKFRFIVFRFINASISCIITYIICIFYNPVSETFATQNIYDTSLTSSTMAGTASLVIMCIIFLISLRKTYYYNKKYRRLS